MLYFLLKYLMFFLFLAFFYRSNSEYVFQAPNIFYSQYCSFANQDNGARSLTCTTPVPQDSIIRTGLSLFQYSKSSWQLIKFTAQVSYSILPTSEFNINIDISEPSNNGMKIGFFLLIIKSQTTSLYVDLASFSWSSGSPVDNDNSNQRTASTNLSVITSTIFTSGTAGLRVDAFTTSFKVIPKYSWDNSQSLEYTLQSILSDPNVTVNLIVESKTQMQEFVGFALLFNPNEISVNKANGMNIDFASNSFAMNGDYNLSSVASSYGPKFNSKCLIGIYHMKYTGNNRFSYSFELSSGGTFQNYKENTGTSAQNEGFYFCFGNGTQCSQKSNYYDGMDGVCYAPAACPLPVPASWTDTNYCPNCTQYTCQKCTQTNRQQCLSCRPDTNTFLNGTQCSCNPDYYQFFMQISTSSSGSWNGIAESLMYCKLNCSEAIQGCKQDDCTNETFCLACELKYFIDPFNSTGQSCELCSSVIDNCIQCQDEFSCTLCEDAYFLQDYSNGTITACAPCSDALSNCIICSDQTTCLTCSLGYNINSTDATCICDPTYNSLPNCLSCILSTVCHICQSNYFLSSITLVCQPCSYIHPNCTFCDNQITCTSCQKAYVLDPSITIGSVSCSLCNDIIDNCVQCSDTDKCTDCAYFYGLNTTTSKCQLCSTILSMPGCQSCQDQSTCLACDYATYMIDGLCHYCSQIFKCDTCFVNSTNQLSCIMCQMGFILKPDPRTGQQICKACFQAINYCFECDLNKCLACIPPYLIGETNLCDQCQTGYQFKLGFCMKIAGCQTSILLKNGTTACIACIPELHFIYDQKHMKCVCSEGYQQFYQYGTLMSCNPICGDGLVLSEYEQCDDSNVISGDGCDKFCKIQQDFKCSKTQPSVCALYLNLKRFEFMYATRVIKENKGILSFLIEPRHQGLINFKWAELIKFNFSSQTTNASQLKFAYFLATGQLQVTVPYCVDLQNQFILTDFTLNSNYILSQTTSFSQVSRLNGVNAPLIVQDSSLLSTFQTINSISQIIIYLLLIQFYIGSYVHKTIGLQTIQIIQLIYFVRITVQGQKNTLLNSINAIQYSAGGYQNSELIFGKDQAKAQSDSYNSVAPEFLLIGLRKYFLLNTNFSLMILCLTILVYILVLARKYYQRSKYISTGLQQFKDKYTQFRRFNYPANGKN